MRKENNNSKELREFEKSEDAKDVEYPSCFIKAYGSNFFKPAQYNDEKEEDTRANRRNSEKDEDARTTSTFSR